MRGLPFLTLIAKHLWKFKILFKKTIVSHENKDKAGKILKGHNVTCWYHTVCRRPFNLPSIQWGPKQRFPTERPLGDTNGYERSNVQRLARRPGQLAQAVAKAACLQGFPGSLFTKDLTPPNLVQAISYSAFLKHRPQDSTLPGWLPREELIHQRLAWQTH